jgi:carbon storage regulator
MLVLSRQRDETIMIGDDVQVTVVDIRGEKVRLGITAPPHIPVHRKEVYEAIQRENRATAEQKGEEPGHVESLAKKKTEDQPPPETPAK